MTGFLYPWGLAAACLASRPVYRRETGSVSGARGSRCGRGPSCQRLRQKRCKGTAFPADGGCFPPLFLRGKAKRGTFAGGSGRTARRRPYTGMNTHSLYFLAAALAAASCAHTREVALTASERIIIDSRYDSRPDQAAVAFLAPYKARVDSVVGPVVGRTASAMKGERPESPLSNLLSDILVWAAGEYGERPVLGIYNMGGIRASLPKGDVTFGDVLEVAPFENKICFLTLSGADLMELFAEMATVGGEGVSRGAELVISKDGRLLSARLHGEAVDPKRDYRIATIDYLAQGNDRMTAFKRKRDYVAPAAADNDTRYIITRYLQQLAAEGRAAEAEVEGRVRVK